MRRPLTIVVLLVVVVSSFSALTSASGRSLNSGSNQTGMAGAAKLAFSGGTPSGNWPTYMYNVERTGANHAEDTIAPSNVSALQELWSIPSNGSDFSAPIVVNGTVYFSSWNGSEEAVNATTGTVEWNTFLGLDTTCGVFTPFGISSTAAYVNGTLLVGGGNLSWYALNARTGSVEGSYHAPWETHFYYNWASALAYDGSLYVGLSSCLDNPLVPAGLLELNISELEANGSSPLVHAFNTTPPDVDGDSIWSSPAVDPQTNTIWVTTGNENSSTDPYYPMYANAIIGLNATTLNVTGSWQVPATVALGQDSDFGTTPTVFTTPSGTPLVIATDKDGYTYAFNSSNVSSNGSWGPIWSLHTGGGWGGAAYEGGTLYVGGEAGTVYAINPDDGDVDWDTTLSAGLIGALTWANGIVYVCSGSSVYAIAASNGTLLWDDHLPGDDSAVAEPIVADGQLYVASGDYGAWGNLTAFGLMKTGALVAPGVGTAATVVLAGLYRNRPDLQQDYPNAFSNVGHYAGLVTWAGGTVTQEWSDAAYSILLPYGYWYALLGLYATRSDLQAAFPNAFTNLTQYMRLVNWAAGTVQGLWKDPAISTLMEFGYYYSLMGVYSASPVLQADYPDAYGNQANYSELVTWAESVVFGSTPSSARNILQPYGYYYTLMGVYNSRPDLQTAYPDAYGNQTSYAGLVTWAEGAVSDQYNDGATSVLQSYGYYYVLMGVYNARQDLQSAYPDAYGSQTAFATLVSWACGAVTNQFVDGDAIVLHSYGYYYALMGVYNSRPDLKAAYPDAYSSQASYSALTAWAEGTVNGHWNDSAYAILSPFASYY